MSVAERIEKAPEMRAIDNDQSNIILPTPYEWIDPDQIVPRQWIYGHELLRGSVSALIGAGAGGKTSYKVVRALALITGRPLLGVPIKEGPKKVWLYNLEDKREEMQRSIQAACKLWNISKDDLGGRLFLDNALDGRPIKIAESSNLNGFRINQDASDGLAAGLIARQIDYLDFDPFVSLHCCDENSNSDIDDIVKEMGRIAAKADCAISLCHHVSKAGSGDVNTNSARGAVSFTAACRSVLALNRMDKKVADEWLDEPGEYRRYFSLEDDKPNRAPPSEGKQWYKLESVPLGQGDWIGVVVPFQAPDVFEGVTSEHLVAVQAMVREHQDTKEGVREDGQATRWVGYLILKALGLPHEKGTAKPKDKAKAKRIFAFWLANRRFEIVQRKDEKSRDRAFIIVGEPVDPNEVSMSRKPAGAGQ